jgi:hypothetical protein
MKYLASGGPAAEEPSAATSDRSSRTWHDPVIATVRYNHPSTVNTQVMSPIFDYARMWSPTVASRMRG